MREGNQPITKQRIGYIDSMRGLMMILVVSVHVAWSSGCNTFPYFAFLGLFRLPLFFFISPFNCPHTAFKKIYMSADFPPIC